jgi:hypothetical protein
VVAGDDRPLITFFTIPKPFSGHTGVIQTNAVRSWRLLGDVILFGDDHGVAEAAAGTNSQHVATIARNELGTPLLSDAFAQAQRISPTGLLCFVNADIVLFPDIDTAARRARPPVLLVGETWNAQIDSPIEFDVGWERRARALPQRRRGADALDYFVFSSGLYDEMPPFAIGRTAFDNWLIWKARQRGARVIDVTNTVHAIHQNHDYAHAGSLHEIRTSPEAAVNRHLAGGKGRLYSRFDATHRAVKGRWVPNPLAWLRVGERARRASHKARHTVLRRRAG